MKHFPIFLNTTDNCIVVVGVGETAVAKLRLILKTQAKVLVFGPNPHETIVDWAVEGKILLHHRSPKAGDFSGVTLVYCASDDPKQDAINADLGKAAGALVNIVDNLKDSQFITPAIVDRSPITVAIGTEGAAPVLARHIKSQLEELLPASLGRLARVGQKFRPFAERLPLGRIRREFWSEFYFKRGPNALARRGQDGARQTLEILLTEKMGQAAQKGRVDFIGTGPGDPDLLTLRARKLLHDADVVIHDTDIPSHILELARREAIIIKAPPGASTTPQLIDHTASGQNVVRLKSGQGYSRQNNKHEHTQLITAGVAMTFTPGVAATNESAPVRAISMPPFAKHWSKHGATASCSNKFDQKEPSYGA